MVKGIVILELELGELETAHVVEGGVVECFEDVSAFLRALGGKLTKNHLSLLNIVDLN